jgi:hypothetical protein
MPYPARSPRKPTVHGSTDPIFGVGRRLFINCPGGREDRATFSDDKGAVLGSLIDGAEVEVLAWMPRGSATRYLVRATRTELSGWLGAANLRTTRLPQSDTLTKQAGAAVWVPPQSTTAPVGKAARRAPRTVTPLDKTTTTVRR